MVESQNALIENIKKKGENSYYYAHAPRNVENIEDAKIIEGEGIVTGGPPKLIKRIDSIHEIAPISNIRNYSWADHEEKLTVYIPFEGSLEENKVSCEFFANGFDLKFNLNESETKRLVLKKLFKNIQTEGSSFKFRKNKIAVCLIKESQGSWYKLTNETN